MPRSNPDDPLNKGLSDAPFCHCHANHRPLTLPVPGVSEAAEDLRRDRQAFARNVTTALKGGSIRGEKYDKLI